MRRREFLARSGLGVVGTALATGLSGCAHLHRGSDDRAAVKEFEEIVPKLIKESAVPGVSMAIVQDGKLDWARGFGIKDAVTREPVDEETLFEAASVSKTVFAYAALKLCEKGVIGLDTPLTRYWAKKFLERDDRLLEMVTARRVLSHTAGFQDWRSEAAPLRFYSGMRLNLLQLNSGSSEVFY